MAISRRDGLSALMAAVAAFSAPRLGRADEPEIVIGNPSALTGFLGEDGLRGTWGLQIAADEINRNGGIKSLGGARLKVIPADTTSDNLAQGASVTRRLIDADQAVMLFGCQVSAITLSAQVQAEKSQIPLITGCYADALVERGMKYTFKTSVKASALSNMALDATVAMMTGAGQPPKSLAICTASTAVDHVIAKSLPIEAERINLPVVAAVSYQNGLTDPSIVIQPVRANKPDLIVLSGGLQDCVLIMQALRGLGIKTPVLTGGGLANDKGGLALGEGAAQVFMNVHWNWDLKTPRNGPLLEAYRAAHPTESDTPNNEQLGIGYTAGLIIAQALEKAASRDGSKIREVLLSSTFKELSQPPGQIAFDETGYNKYAQGIVVEWMNPKETRTVWPRELATAQAVFGA
jgi:branched-chain amino acid transport system substrate-binding protein